MNSKKKKKRNVGIQSCQDASGNTIQYLVRQSGRVNRGVRKKKKTSQNLSCPRMNRALNWIRKKYFTRAAGFLLVHTIRTPAQVMKDTSIASTYLPVPQHSSYFAVPILLLSCAAPVICSEVLSSSLKKQYRSFLYAPHRVKACWGEGSCEPFCKRLSK